MDLGALTAVLDELVTSDPASLADAESVVALYRQLDRLEAVTTRATACFDTGGDWALDGARTTADWISRRCHRSRPAAKAEIALARALRHLPAAQAVWLSGDIGAGHVKALAQLRRPATEAQLAADEPSWSATPRR